MKKLLVLSGGLLAGTLLLWQITKPKIPGYTDEYVEVPPHRLYYRLHNHAWHFLLVRRITGGDSLTLGRFRTGRIVDTWHEMRKTLDQRTTDALQARLREATATYW